MMTTNKLSHVFVMSLTANEREATIEAPPRPPVVVGAPPEYGGDADVWSPEHLLLGSVSACFWTTLRSLAARKDVILHGVTCRATGQVDKTPDGLAFSKIDLAVDVEVDAESFADAHALVENAKRRCLVTQSLRCPVTVTSIVTTKPSRREEPVDVA